MTTTTATQGSFETAADYAAFRHLVLTRKSVRSFRPELLPESRLRELLELAAWSPSNCNTQPWQVHLASGATLERVRVELAEHALAEGQSPEIPYNAEHYPPEMNERRGAHFADYQRAFGIEREDAEGRNRLLQMNLRFFDAPHVLFLYLPAFANEREASDLGMFAQTFLLALEAAGLGGLPQTSVGTYGAPIRRVLQPAEGHRLMFAIAFGYEDRSFSGARLVQEREPIDRFTVFHR